MVQVSFSTKTSKLRSRRRSYNQCRWKKPAETDCFRGQTLKNDDSIFFLQKEQEQN